MTSMDTVTIRDLRNHGGEVIDRVSSGASITVHARRSTGRRAAADPVPRRCRPWPCSSGGDTSRPSTQPRCGRISTASSIRPCDRPTGIARHEHPVVAAADRRSRRAAGHPVDLGDHPGGTLRRATRDRRRRRASASDRSCPAGRSRLRAHPIRRGRGARVRPGCRVPSVEPGASLRHGHSTRSIAAIAIANGLPLYTCNPGDFADIDGLTVRAVPIPTDRRYASGCGSWASGTSSSAAELMQ